MRTTREWMLRVAACAAVCGMISAAEPTTTNAPVGAVGMQVQHQERTPTAEMSATSFPGQAIVECRLIELPAGALTKFELGAVVADETAQKLLTHPDTEVLTAPRVTTRFGQTAQIRVGNDYPYITGYARDEKTGELTPIAETKECGVSVTCLVTPVGDDPQQMMVTVDLTVTDQKEGPERAVPVKGTHASVNLRMPLFSTRTISTALHLRSGETALLGGLGEAPAEGNAQRVLVATLKASYQTSALETRARQIIIPQIEFLKAGLADVLGFLRAAAREQDPAKEGVNLVLIDPSSTPDLLTFPPAARLVSLNVQKMSLYDVLRFVAAATGLQVEYGENAVVLRAQPR